MRSADETPDAQRVRAALVMCMDYIMHHMNDEEAIDPWLVDGHPDGDLVALEDREGLVDGYLAHGYSRDEFDDLVALFATLLARQVMPGLPPLAPVPKERGVLS